MTQGPAEHAAVLNGVSLHWFEWGAPGPEPSIVLIHATGFHARCWDQVVKALPGRHVLALDLRGHGRSGKTPPFSWDSYGNDLVAWAEHLGLAGAIAAGHSMGGYVSLAFTDVFPKNVKGLCLLNSTAVHDSNQRKEFRDLAIRNAKKVYEKVVRISVRNLFSEKNQIEKKSEVEHIISFGF